jgi:hypothetical protein
MPDIKGLSEPNKQWGICGFVSSLAALYVNNSGVQKKLGKISPTDFETRLLAEVKTFLVQLEADNNKALLGEIETFNKKWEKAFTIGGFIAKVNKAVDKVPKDATLAMTPDALRVYLDTAWGVKGKFKKGMPDAKSKNVILGLYEKADAHAFNLLKHWVFMADKDHVYNYGEETTLDELKSEYLKRKPPRVIDGYIQL